MSEPLSKLVIPSPVGPMQAFASALGLRAALCADSDPSRSGVSGPVKTGEEIPSSHWAALARVDRRGRALRRRRRVYTHLG